MSGHHDTTPLMEACCGGHADVVRTLINAGADVNAVSSTHNTALIYACSGGHYECVKELLSSGKCDVSLRNETGHCALMEAASIGNVEILKLLVEHGATPLSVVENLDFKESALTLAAYKGHLAAVEYLISVMPESADRDEEFHTALMEASMDGHVEVTKALLNAGAPVNLLSDTFESPLTLAACGGHTELVSLLIDFGADLEESNDEGYTPLMEASREGHRDVVELLLDRGANVNAKIVEGMETPLTLAASGGFLNVVELLVSRGGDLTIGSPLYEATHDNHADVAYYIIQQLRQTLKPKEMMDDLNSALICAAEINNVTVCNMLLENNAQIECVSQEGRTPLMEAAKQGNMLVVELLIHKGAKVNKISLGNECTALSLAAANGHADVLRYLLDHGADPHQVLKDSSTCLLEASKNGHTNCVEILLDHTPLGKKGASCENTAVHHNHHSQKASTKNNGACIGSGVTSKKQSSKQCANLMDTSNTCAGGKVRDGAGGALSNHSKPISLQNIPKAIRQKSKSFTQKDVALAAAAASACANNRQRLNKKHTTPIAVIGSGKRSCCSVSGVEKTDSQNTQPAKISNQQTKASQTSSTRLTSTSSLTADAAITMENLDKGMANASQLFRALAAAASSSATPYNAPDDWLFAQFIQRSLITTKRREAMSEEELRQFTEMIQQQFRNIFPSGQFDAAALVESANKHRATTTTSSASNALPFPPPGRPDTEGCKVDNNDEVFYSRSKTPPPLKLCKLANTANRKRRQNSAVPTVSNGKEAAPENNSLIDASGSEEIFVSENEEEEISSEDDVGDMESDDEDDDDDGNSASELDEEEDAELSSPPSSLTSVSPPLTPSAVTANASPFACCQQAIVDSVAIGATTTTTTTTISAAAAVGAKPAALSGGKAESSTLPATTAAVNTGKKSGPTTTLNPATRGCSATTHHHLHTGVSGTKSMRGGISSAQKRRNNNTKISSMGTNSAALGTCCSNQESAFVDMQTETNHDTALTLACVGGHTSLAQLLIKRGADLEHRDKKGFTPLILAATGGHLEICRMLIEAGCLVDAQADRTKDTALSLACSGGRKDVVDLLLRCGAHKEHRNISDYTPLSLAASGGYVDIIQILLNNGAEINSRTGSKLGISPLMLSAMNGHEAATLLLLENGSDINAQIETNRNTALTLACFQGRTEVVRLLLHYGANVEHRAKTGLTPLMEAANGGYVDVGTLLLDAHADPNAAPVMTSRDTALSIAADKGHAAFVELLIHAGAQINVRNKKGCSALWLACCGGHLETVQTLLNHHADPDEQDNRKVSPLIAAFRKGHTKIVKLIVERVSQFPSDQECDRYVSTLTEQDLIVKCRQCIDYIVDAKAKQAEEANKAAESLLEMLAHEEALAESKKRSKQRQKEKKKAKKNAKKKLTEDDVIAQEMLEDDKSNSKDEENDENKPAEEESISILGDDKLLKQQDKKSSIIHEEELRVPFMESIHERAVVSTTRKQQDQMCSVENIADVSPKQQLSSVISSVASHKASRRPTRRRGGVKSTAIAEAVKSATAEQTLSSSSSSTFNVSSASATGVKGNGGCTGSSSAEDAEWLKASKKRVLLNKSHPPAVCGKTVALSSASTAKLSSIPSTQHYKAIDGLIEEWNPELMSQGGGNTFFSATTASSASSRRKCSQVLNVASSAIARVIGRAGSNINAIREATNAHIEVEKMTSKREQPTRMITIKGTQDAVKNSLTMIEMLIKDQDMGVNDILRHVMGSNHPAVVAATTDESRSGSASQQRCSPQLYHYMENNSAASLMHSASLSKANLEEESNARSSSSPSVTNVWQQRAAIRELQKAVYGNNATKIGALQQPFGSECQFSQQQRQLAPSPGGVSVLSSLGVAGDNASSSSQQNMKVVSILAQEEHQRKAPGYARPNATPSSDTYSTTVDVSDVNSVMSYTYQSLLPAALNKLSINANAMSGSEVSPKNDAVKSSDTSPSNNTTGEIKNSSAAPTPSKTTWPLADIWENSTAADQISAPGSLNLTGFLDAKAALWLPTSTNASALHKQSQFSTTPSVSGINKKNDVLNGFGASDGGRLAFSDASVKLDESAPEPAPSTGWPLADIWENAPALDSLSSSNSLNLTGLLDAKTALWLPTSSCDAGGLLDSTSADVHDSNSNIKTAFENMTIAAELPAFTNILSGSADGMVGARQHAGGSNTIGQQHPSMLRHLNNQHGGALPQHNHQQRSQQQPSMQHQSENMFLSFSTGGNASFRDLNNDRRAFSASNGFNRTVSTMAEQQMFQQQQHHYPNVYPFQQNTQQLEQMYNGTHGGGGEAQNGSSSLASFMDFASNASRAQQHPPALPPNAFVHPPPGFLRQPPPQGAHSFLSELSQRMVAQQRQKNGGGMKISGFNAAGQQQQFGRSSTAGGSGGEVGNNFAGLFQFPQQQKPAPALFGLPSGNGGGGVTGGNYE